MDNKNLIQRINVRLNEATAHIVTRSVYSRGMLSVEYA